MFFRYSISIFEDDIVSLHDGRNGRSIGRWTTDTFGFELLHETGFGISGGVTIVGRHDLHVIEIERLSLFERRKSLCACIRILIFGDDTIDR